MKVFVTKYWQSHGILEKNGDKSSDYPRLFVTDEPWKQYYHKPYWHENRQDAVEHAERLRVKKIASLRKQIRKIEGMTFDPAK